MADVFFDLKSRMMKVEQDYYKACHEAAESITLDDVMKSLEKHQYQYDIGFKAENEKGFYQGSQLHLALERGFYADIRDDVLFLQHRDLTPVMKTFQDPRIKDYYDQVSLHLLAGYIAH
ncbi:hypothetical protein JW711_02460 [Candidatus Woesearchaeota archaeon]|nr:hypothetical protein [Candidatus Woesearchaeota archaeon]